MKVYWTLLIVSLGTYVLYENTYSIRNIYGVKRKTANGIHIVPLAGLLTIFCGLRSGIADTGTYIYMFENTPSNPNAIDWNNVDTDKGYVYLTALYKQFISEDYHGWFFIIAAISVCAVFYGFYKYSEEYGLTCVLFIATTFFTYLVNGMRQFICISIVFAATGWIVQKKYIRYILLVLLLSTIHASVLIFIPLCFVVSVRPWSKSMIALIAGSVLAGFNMNLFLPFMGSLLEDTQYSGYMDLLTTGSGSSVIRLLLSLIPCGIAFMSRKVVEVEGNKIIDISINMSVINACLYLIATFSSGMVIGRLLSYFEIYNLILLPWLIRHSFEKKSASVVCITSIVMYILYFYYQMVITWNLPYESDILNLFIYN